jgi:hypothetical protein
LVKKKLKSAINLPNTGLFIKIKQIIELKVLEHRSDQANLESKMNITLHIGNKECGTCIPKDINTAYKMDENDLNVHI